jgi:hypothetical protein
MLAKAYSIELSLVWLMMVVPIILAAARAPISLQGWGVQEGAYAFIFSSAGIPLSNAVMISMTGRILLILSSFPGALWTLPPVKSNVSPQIVVQGSDPQES